MSNTDALRDALKGASEPMTTADLADLAGIERGDAAKLLYAMTQSGEVIKQEGEDGGKPTYLRNPEFKPKRAGAAESVAAKPTCKAKAGRKAKAPKAERKSPRGRKPKPRSETPAQRRKAVKRVSKAVGEALSTATAAQVAQAATAPVVTVPLAAVRALVSHAMRGHQPLDVVTRQAVLDVVKEAA